MPRTRCALPCSSAHYATGASTSKNTTKGHAKRECSEIRGRGLLTATSIGATAHTRDCAVVRGQVLYMVSANVLRDAHHLAQLCDVRSTLGRFHQCKLGSSSMPLSYTVCEPAQPVIRAVLTSCWMIVLAAMRSMSVVQPATNA